MTDNALFRHPCIGRRSPTLTPGSSRFDAAVART